MVSSYRITPETNCSAPGALISSPRYSRRLDSVQSTPMVLKRVSQVPLDSSAASSPRPFATIAAAVLASSVLSMGGIVSPPNIALYILGAMRFTERLRRPELAVETILLLGSLFLASAANLVFWHAALAGRPAADPATLRYVAATFVLLAAAHFFVLGLIATRQTVRPLLALAIVASAALGYYMQRYGVVFDASMVRNVLRT